MALVRLTAALVLALASGCGADDEGAATPAAAAAPANPGLALTRSAAALREHRTFTFDASFTRVKATSPDEVDEYATAKGAVDLYAGAGRAELDLDDILGEGEEARSANPLKDPVAFRWAGESITVTLLGHTQTLGRADMQADRGLVARYPDEVESLDDVLAKPLRPRLLDREGGTAHYAFAYDAKAAGRLGIPAELNAAFEEALYGPRLELEAWIAEDGLPHRVSYAIQLKPTRSGSARLPARTVRVTYELHDFGDEFEPRG